MHRGVESKINHFVFPMCEEKLRLCQCWVDKRHRILFGYENLGRTNPLDSSHIDRQNTIVRDVLTLLAQGHQ